MNGRKTPKLQPANLAASVRARLLNIAKQSNREYNAVLIQYVQERFLYRLSVSPHNSKFVLKGALLLLSYHIPRFRPTKDIDFLGMGMANDLGEVRTILQEIARVPYNDAVSFEAEEVTVEGITEHAQYRGVRARIPATIGGAEIVLWIDIGFGDQIVAGPVAMDFPSLIDMPAPSLFVYSLETSIAEKFEAMVKFGTLTSRMKDFYDILFLASHVEFRLRPLREAVHTTFEHRSTSIEDAHLIFLESYRTDRDRALLWTAFITSHRLEAMPHFSDVIERLAQFLTPVLQSTASEQTWDPKSFQWK